jgi:pimeloyl-ACP methyl ester carboxylesterase
MAEFVLVPGAWLGAWVWERVTPFLRSSGHVVHPITLPGLADRARELSPKVGIMAHVDDLIATCEDFDLEEAFLVGHNYAGAVTGAVARRIPETFAGQVYLDTMPLDEGAGLLDGFTEDGRAKFESEVKTVGGTRVWPMPEPLSSQSPVEGLTSADLTLLRDRGTPHPALTFEEKLTGPVQHPPYPPCHTISCVEGANAAAVERRAFLEQHPDWTYHWLPICHWPMLSSPSQLASVLDRIAKG